MISFRQPIYPRQQGRDVRAVKRALDRMGHRGLDGNDRAGAKFVAAIKAVQRAKRIRADGIYGHATHRAIAPHFDLYARLLYRTARIRKRHPHPDPSESAQAAARRLLAYRVQGKYHADNEGDLTQIEATAAGRAVWSPGGYWVHLDRRTLEALVMLIERGHRVGTYAICSDHPYDGPHGHAGGHAVDISSFDGVSIASSTAGSRTVDLARTMHNEKGLLAPWQLISGGWGERIQRECEALTIPSAGFYGSKTMQQHTNHVHVGYY